MACCLCFLHIKPYWYIFVTRLLQGICVIIFYLSTPLCAHVKSYFQIIVVKRKSNLTSFYQKQEMKCANPVKPSLAKCWCNTSGFVLTQIVLSIQITSS